MQQDHKEKLEETAKQNDRRLKETTVAYEEKMQQLRRDQSLAIKTVVSDKDRDLQELTAKMEKIFHNHEVVYRRISSL